MLYAPGMANRPERMRLHQFTCEADTPKKGRRQIKYFSNGAFVSNVELSSKQWLEPSPPASDGGRAPPRVFFAL